MVIFYNLLYINNLAPPPVGLEEGQVLPNFYISQPHLLRIRLQNYYFFFKYRVYILEKNVYNQEKNVYNQDFCIFPKVHIFHNSL